MTFQNVSRQQLVTLNRLSSAEFQPFRELLQSTHTDVMGRLAKADDLVMIHRLQGAANVLDALLKAIAEAQSRLSRDA